MQHVNQINLTGTMADEPQFTVTKNGNTVSNFTVYTETQSGGFIVKEWHKCVAWNNLTELVGKHQKGDFIKLSGQKNTRTYLNRDGLKVYITEVNVEKIDQPMQMPAQSAAPQANQQYQQANQQYQQTQPPYQSYAGQNQKPIKDNDIPF